MVTALNATLAALVLLGAWLWRRLSLQRSAGGIATSATVRSGRMVGLVLRRLLRKGRFWLQGRLASRERRARLHTEYHVRSATEMTEALGQMKGVFMKIGQILSFADDSLPPEAKAIMAGLQQSAPPMDFALTRRAVEAELGGDLASAFRQFDEEPIAAASIGQVHRAELRDGTVVAVKVQYPGVDAAIEKDLQATDGLAAMIGVFNRNIDAKAVVAELTERMADELDYRIEAHNQALFHRLWAGHPLIRIPAVYRELTTKRMLVQQFQRGLGYRDFLAVSSTEDRNLTAHVLSDFVWDSMFRFHVFNGDPHPGNYLFHDDGGMTFLDFGCIKYFPTERLAAVLRLFESLVREDREAFRRACEELLLVLPGRPFDGQFLWDFFRYQAGPYIRDEIFTFTPAYLQQAREVMDLLKLQRINLPADLLFFNRITFGLNAIFSDLGARANFYRVYERYLYPERNLPPALASLGITLPPVFLQAARAPQPAVPRGTVSHA